MAKLPEYYAEEKAKKAIAKKEKEIEREKEKVEKKKRRERYTDDGEKIIARAKDEIFFNNIIASLTKKPLIKIASGLSDAETQQLMEDLKKIDFNEYPITESDLAKYLEQIERARVPEENNRGTEYKKKPTVMRKDFKEFVTKRNEVIKNNFHPAKGFLKYDKYPCSCCGLFQKVDEFYKSYSYANVGRMDDDMNIHAPICKTCAKELFFLFYEENGHDDKKALEEWCCATNTYWEEYYYNEARIVYDNNYTSTCIIPDYIAALGRSKKFGLTYWDSIKSADKGGVIEHGHEVRKWDPGELDDRVPIGWSREEVRLKKKIISLLRYDPFEIYPEDDARKMYYDFDLMIDETMTEDILKLKAAIEIVCGHYKIEKLRLKEIEMEKSGDYDDKALQAIVDRRAKELVQINKFAQENGFSERYATKKAKGAGTLTGVMNEMRVKAYEPSLSNYYSVKTCKEMQEAANMSMQAIFNQLGMSDSEAWGMVQKQTTRILDLTRQVEQLKEELRQKEIHIKKRQLVKLARDKAMEEQGEGDGIKLMELDEIEQEMDSIVGEFSDAQIERLAGMVGKKRSSYDKKKNDIKNKIIAQDVLET